MPKKEEKTMGTSALYIERVEAAFVKGEYHILAEDGTVCTYDPVAGYFCRSSNSPSARAVDVFDGRRAWTKTHLGESPLNKAEAHMLAHKLRDPKFYTARTKRAVNSGGVL
jgi:hypothetical protein